jgi:RNA polymerase sigma-70 factor (ECF subfamily)
MDMHRSPAGSAMSQTARSVRPAVQPSAGGAKAPGQSRGVFEADLRDRLPDLRHYALSLTRDPVEAEDLVQDCLVRAIDRRHHFEPGTHLGRWLFTILRNLHVDSCRKRRRRGVQVPWDEAMPATSRPASQEHWIELMDVARALRGLRPCDRDILMLCAFSSLSQREIATRLNLAEGTVRSRLSRARTALRP